MGCVVKVLAGVFFAGVVIALALVAVLANMSSGPCAEYRNAVTARQNAIDYNARRDKQLAEDWITEEQHAEMLKEVPPEPVEPEGGC